MLALAVFACIVLAVLLGYPVAIALGGVSLVIGYIALGPAFMQFLPSRLFGVLSNYVLLAVPMFILMGLALQRSGLTEVLMRSAARLAGKRAGGLAIAVLIVGTLLAASTGIVGASVVTLALIALPVMRKAGYADHVSAGVVAAVGSLGQVVPPSIVLILLASVMQISVGGLFKAALLPSALIVGGYALYLIGRATLAASTVPALGDLKALPEPGLNSPDEDEVPLWLGILGPLMLIGGVLGSILAGVASPTEASGVGAVAAFGLLAASGRMRLIVVRDICTQALRLSSMIFLILFGATTFALVFRGLEGDQLLVQLIGSAGLSAREFMALLLFVVFIAGFFIDFIEIIFIVVPVVLPLIAFYGIDPMSFAILLGINLQTSFLTPPFGFSLFYLRGAAPPDLATKDIYRGVMPYILVQLIVLVGLFFYYV